MPFFNTMINTIISSVDDNPNLCRSGSCKKKKSSIVVPIAASLGGLLILSLIIAATLSRLGRRKQQENTKGEDLNYKIHIEINKEKNSTWIKYVDHTHHDHLQFSYAMVDTESKNQNASLESIQRQFTYSELLKITNNFEMILGKGGFGTVYRGRIDDTQVAVKMLSPSSVQGFQQFQSEACKNFTLIYIHMAGLIGILKLS